mgnify:FL=1
MALNLAKAVLGFLKERPEEKLTARQIIPSPLEAFSCLVAV